MITCEGSQTTALDRRRLEHLAKLGPELVELAKGRVHVVRGSNTGNTFGDRRRLEQGYQFFARRLYAAADARRGAIESRLEDVFLEPLGQLLTAELVSALLHALGDAVLESTK